MADVDDHHTPRVQVRPDRLEELLRHQVERDVRLPDSNALEKVVSATLHAVFPVVKRDQVNGTSSLVTASAGDQSSARLAAAGASLPPDLRGLGATVAARLAPALTGGAVYTDDRAPVEWLTDLSILSYAAGHR